MKVGSLGLFGLTLQDVLRLQDKARASTNAGRYDGSTGYGSAKSVIVLFLQGGPSHIDIWDPKPEAPSNVRGEFKPIKTKIPGIHLSETMPMLADTVDKCTLIRSMSYTPAGLFNHTAAIYQMLTGYEPTEVSPSGQLEPPSPNDYPTAGSWITKFRPPADPVLPFVELPRPLQESSVIGKGGAAGFIGKAFDPYRLYQDPNKAIRLDDLSLRQEVPPQRLKDRFTLLKGINKSMPDLEKAVGQHALDEYYERAYDLVLSGKARKTSSAVPRQRRVGHQLVIDLARARDSSPPAAPLLRGWRRASDRGFPPPNAAGLPGRAARKRLRKRVGAPRLRRRRRPRPPSRCPARAAPGSGPGPEWMPPGTPRRRSPDRGGSGR